jgi:hypothetical protein
MKGLGAIVRAAAKSSSTAAQRDFEQFDNRRENRGILRLHIFY